MNSTTGEHWGPDGWSSYLEALIWVAVSIAFFRLCQSLVRFYIFGELVLGEFSLFGWIRDRANYEQEEEEIPEKTKWRISNEIISILHSVISGLWAAYAILMQTDLVYDYNVTNNTCIYLVFVMAGYLIHDFLDLILNEGSCRIAELLYHHIVVLCAFCIPFVFEMFMGIVMLGLLMEVNSIALHTRSLCNLYRVDKRSMPFRCLAMCNLISFVLFRIIVSGYLCYWLFNIYFEVVFWKWFVCLFVIGSLTISNLILFYRVMQADGFFGKKRAERRNKKDANKESEWTSSESTLPSIS